MTRGFPLQPEEVATGSVVWLLDLTWAGRVWRFASEPVEVASDDGEVLTYTDGLDVRGARRGVDLFDDTPDIPAVVLRGLVFPQDVAELVAQGHWWETGTGVLRQWVSGRTLEQARVWVAGRVASVSYESVDDPVQLTLEPYELEDRAVIPAAEAVVSTETWPDADDAAMGRSYPLVIGKPGFEALQASGLNGGSPGLVVDVSADTILIADGHVAATEVVLVDGATETACTVSTTLDGRGRRVSYITHPTGVTAGADYSIRWDASDGGVLREDRTAALRGAGDVLVWLLEQSTVPLDRGAWAALVPELDVFDVDFYVDADQSPWDIARGAILPLLPLSVVSGPDGVRPVLWRVGARASDAAEHLEAGRNVERVSAVEHLRPPIANEHRLRYAQATDGTYTRVAVVSGDDDQVGDSDIQPTMHAVASAATFGPMVAETIESRVVQSADTAWRVLAWRSVAYAFPWRLVSYRDLSGALAGVEAGSVVLLTDSELHLSSAVAWVRDVVWDDAVPTAELVLVHDPARDRA